jgi:hypothetical protein
MATAYFEMVDRVFCALAEREERDGARSINDIERVVLLVWHASGILGNGGFRYFFECGLSLRETAEAYRRIGVEKAVSIFSDVEELFGGKTLAEDYNARIEAFERVYQQHRERFDRLERDYYATNELMECQLAGWIDVHKDVFDGITDRLTKERVGDIVTKAYFPSIKGAVALVLVLFVGIFIPSIFPARAHGRPPSLAHASEESWIVAILSLALSGGASVYAFLRGNRPDKWTASGCILLLIWFILEFFLFT